MHQGSKQWLLNFGATALVACLIRAEKIMRSWQMQQAKARFSELLKSAQAQGPQEITLHGKPVAVVLSRVDFDKMARTGESFVDFMRRSPLYGLDELAFERNPSAVRDRDLSPDAWFQREVQRGQDEANAGKLIPAEDVEAEAAAWRTEFKRKLTGGEP
jgi:prevent-host-death family protein